MFVSITVSSNTVDKLWIKYLRSLVSSILLERARPKTASWKTDDSNRRTVVERKNGQKVTLKIAGSTVDYRDCFRLPSIPGRVRKVELDHPNRTHKSDAVALKQGRLNLLFSFGVSRLYDTVPRYVQYSERCIILRAIRSYGRAYAGVETSLLASWSFDPRSITKLEKSYRSNRVSCSCFDRLDRVYPYLVFHYRIDDTFDSHGFSFVFCDTVVAMIFLTASSVVVNFFVRLLSCNFLIEICRMRLLRTNSIENTNETNWKYFLSKSRLYQRKRSLIDRSLGRYLIGILAMCAFFCVRFGRGYVLRKTRLHR